MNGLFYVIIIFVFIVTGMTLDEFRAIEPGLKLLIQVCFMGFVCVLNPADRN